jgi:hypothetical protein
LKRRGSCLRLLYLLAKKRELIHQLGKKGITVLHKGVEHGCVRLVKFILVDMFDDEGVRTCKVHGPDDSRLTRDQLLRKTRVIARKTCQFCCILCSTHEIFWSTLKLEKIILIKK